MPPLPALPPIPPTPPAPPAPIPPIPPELLETIPVLLLLLLLELLDTTSPLELLELLAAIPPIPLEDAPPGPLLDVPFDEGSDEQLVKKSGRTNQAEYRSARMLERKLEIVSSSSKLDRCASKISLVRLEHIKRKCLLSSGHI